MKWFTDLKIAQKILTSFILVTLITVFVGYTGISNIKKISIADEQMYHLNTVPLAYIGTMSMDYQKMRVAYRDLFIDKNVTNRNAYIVQIKQLREEINTNLNLFEQTTKLAEVKMECDKLRNALQNLEPITDKMIALAQAGKLEEANNLLRSGSATSVVREIDDSISKLVKIKVDNAQAKANNNSIVADKAMNTMLGLLCLAIALAMGLGIFLARLLSLPIKKLTEASQQLSVGATDIDINISSKDEIGELAQAFQEMACATKEQAEVGQKIARGDLSIEIKERSEKDVMTQSLILIMETLRSLITEADKLTEAAAEGKLEIRGEANKFEGGFKRIIQGVNNTLDAVVEPIQEATGVLQELQKGNLAVRVTGNYAGDYALIKNGLNETIDNIRSYIREISDVLGEMARGNLVVNIDREYRGDFIQIKNALNMIINAFNDVLSEINMAAEQVASGARQVSISSQTLSQGSTEQAGSLEEISASITQMAAQTKQNAENAGLGNELAISAQENAVHGNKQMQEMLHWMNQINEASNSISKIIKVIDEIAFQTNILSLNAAVEAARAGQHGKGFAVVAEEVRNLAARSANAAKETTLLIEGSMEKVQTGTKIANQTADALNNIVEQVSKVADLVAGITEASKEQAGGIAQINQAIAQVDQVVQMNTATSEESASASEELSSQADLLRERVEKFKLKNNRAFNSYQAENNIEATVSQPKINIALDDCEFGKY